MTSTESQRENFFRAASHEAEKFNYPTNVARRATRTKIFVYPFKRFWITAQGWESFRGLKQQINVDMKRGQKRRYKKREFSRHDN